MTSYSELALVRTLTTLADSQQVVAHNLANVGTPGFKRNASISDSGDPRFLNMLETELPMPVFHQAVDHTAGDLEATGNDLDLSLEGDGFFRVRDKAGREYLTRGGRATLDPQGYLMTTSGMQLLDFNGKAIQVRGADGIPGQINISASGLIDDGLENGAQWGPIGVVNVEDHSSLQPLGSGLFQTSASDPAQSDPRTLVRQGFVERSNVNTVDELVRMIGVQRSFQGTQKALTAVSRMRAEYVQTMNR